MAHHLIGRPIATAPVAPPSSVVHRNPLHSLYSRLPINRTESSPAKPVRATIAGGSGSDACKQAEPAPARSPPSSRLLGIAIQSPTATVLLPSSTAGLASSWTGVQPSVKASTGGSKSPKSKEKENRVPNTTPERVTVSTAGSPKSSGHATTPRPAKSARRTITEVLTDPNIMKRYDRTLCCVEGSRLSDFHVHCRPEMRLIRRDVFGALSALRRTPVLTPIPGTPRAPGSDLEPTYALEAKATAPDSVASSTSTDAAPPTKPPRRDTLAIAEKLKRANESARKMAVYVLSQCCALRKLSDLLVGDMRCRKNTELSKQYRSMQLELQVRKQSLTTTERLFKILTAEVRTAEVTIRHLTAENRDLKV